MTRRVAFPLLPLFLHLLRLHQHHIGLGELEPPPGQRLLDGAVSSSFLQRSQQRFYEAQQPVLDLFRFKGIRAEDFVE